jgi:branched-chain amino acid aminotransferase
MTKINIELTKAPKQKPDEGSLGFGRIFTDHMFVVEYEEGKGWYKADIMPYQALSLEPTAMVLHYGQAIFEGLKCYRSAEGKLLLFRPERNFERLNASCDRMCIPHIDEEFALKALMELIQIEKDWVPSAPGTSLYIRPFVIATQSSLGVHPSGFYKFIILLSPVGAYYASGLNPVKISIENEYVRAVKGGAGHTKAAANYATSLKGQSNAQKKGYAQVLWLDGVERKYIEEVGAMNVFFKIGGKLFTPSLSGSILPGVTRDSVIQIAKNMGLSVEEKRITVQEIYQAYEDGTLEEAFGTGTAAVISPIGRFEWDGREFDVADGGIGPVSQRLYDELTGLQYGRNTDSYGWVREVAVNNK